MPDKKMYRVSFPLYAFIDPAGCDYQILGTKVELKLKKGNCFSHHLYGPNTHSNSGRDLMANFEKRRGNGGDYPDWKTGDCIDAK